MKKYNRLLAFLFFTLIISFSSCKKDPEVEIMDAYAVIENCASPFIVTFYCDISTNKGEAERVWEFGDGDGSREDNPQHIFQEHGVYEIVLTAKNENASDRKTIVLDLRQDTVPIADFDFEFVNGNYMAPAEVKFFNLSKYATGFRWEFGSGETSTRVEPGYTYTTPGEYEIALYANCAGYTDTITQMVNIEPPPADIAVKSITVWVPQADLGKRLFYRMYYDIHLEDDSQLYTVTPSRSPVSWPLSAKDGELFFFDGTYDGDIIRFEVWDADNTQSPLYIFSTNTRALWDDYFPTTIEWNDGSYGAEVILTYY